MYDVAIIGAGITGCAIAYELGKYNVKAVIVEKENDVSVGTTKANSAIIHGGYDPKPGTKMAEYNIKGNVYTKKISRWMKYRGKWISVPIISASSSSRRQEETLLSTLQRSGFGMQGNFSRIPGFPSRRSARNPDTVIQIISAGYSKNMKV